MVTSRPVVSLATAIVVGLCLFFILTKENQIKQGEEKIQLFKARNTLAVLAGLPFPINYTPKVTSDLLYRRVELEGDFLVDHEIYLDNRVAEDNSIAISKKNPGFHIMMPYLLKTGQIIWVNRGWIMRDPANRKNIPTIKHPPSHQKLHGYIAESSKDIFEMPSERPRNVNGHIVALNFYLYDDKKDLPNRDVYPFLIIQTGQGSDGLVRPNEGYLFQPNYTFELRTWWFTLLFALGFWFVNGLIARNRKVDQDRLDHQVL
jgi:cytochrome oxidase assembly protein ShyY1